MSPDPASLENLRGIALPAPVPWWPPAPGWWILAAGLLAAGGLAAWRQWRHYRANAYRREARRQLDAIGRRVEAGMSDGAAAELAAVLKRAALAAYPRAQVASLTGAAWLAFLDRTGRTTAFSSGPGRWLGQWAYAGRPPHPPSSLKAALEVARRWVAHHDQPGGPQPC